MSRFHDQNQTQMLTSKSVVRSFSIKVKALNLEVVSLKRFVSLRNAAIINASFYEFFT